MTDTASIQALVSEFADLWQSFLQGDVTLAEVEAQTGLETPEIYECLNQYVANVNYAADTYNLGGDQVVHLPAPPPVAPGEPAAVYETVVNNYQQNIVNDYSTEVNQIFNNDGDVNINQAVAGAGGIANTGTIDDSVLAAGGGDVTFGDNTAIGNENSNINQNSGDITAEDGSAVAVGQSTAETTGSGNDFGDGDNTVQAVSDSTDVNQADVDVDLTGTGGGNATGGAGGAGGDGSFGGAGGAGGAATGGADSDGIDDSPVTVTVQQDVEPEPQDFGPIT